MTPLEIEQYILDTFKDVHPINSWGEKSFFHNPGKKLTRGTYFATLKEKDGDNDKASDLDRDGIYRLNIGLRKSKYINLFQTTPVRPPKGGVIEGLFDFQKLDSLTPHPIYAWMSWVAVLNPSSETFESCKQLLEDAYIKASKSTENKIQKL